MFFPKCAPNGILGVEGTLAYVAQNCQRLAHIPPIRTTLKYNRSLEKHVLAHFQQTCFQIYFCFSSYSLRKPLLNRSNRIYL